MNTGCPCELNPGFATSFHPVASAAVLACGAVIRPADASGTSIGPNFFASNSFNSRFAAIRSGCHSGKLLVAISPAATSSELLWTRIWAWPESVRLIGKKIKAKRICDDLRSTSNAHVDTALGVPAEPNSGLSVRLIKAAPAAPAVAVEQPSRPSELA